MEDFWIRWREYPGISMALLMVPELHPVSDELHLERLCPGSLGWRKCYFQFLLLGIVDSHVVIESHKQEKPHALPVGEDGGLHVRDHPEQLYSALMLLFAVQV